MNQPLKLDFDAALTKACENATKAMKANHSWTNRTGTMEAKIGWKKVSDEEYEITIDVPYATHVNYWKPYLDQFEQIARTMVYAELESMRID